LLSFLPVREPSTPPPPYEDEEEPDADYYFPVIQPFNGVVGFLSVLFSPLTNTCCCVFFSLAPVDHIVMALNAWIDENPHELMPAISSVASWPHLSFSPHGLT